MGKERMISFNDFRRKRLNSAIYQTDSVVEGINYYFDIFRLDLLEASQLSYTITEGQDPQVVEALNWIIAYDNDRHKQIVEALISKAKDEFYGELTEDIHTDLEDEIKNMPPAVHSSATSDIETLKKKIDWTIDHIVSRYQQEIIAQLTGAAGQQNQTAGGSGGGGGAGGASPTATVPPATPQANSSAPSTPPTPAATPPSPSTPPGPDTPWGTGHPWFKKSQLPGMWGKISNLGRSAIKGIGNGVRGAYRWAKNAANGQYLDHAIIEQVLVLMENVYEEADLGIASMFDQLKHSLKTIVGHQVDGWAGGQTAPGAPNPTTPGPSAPSATPTVTPTKTATPPGLTPVATRTPGAPPATVPAPAKSVTTPGVPPNPLTSPGATATPPVKPVTPPGAAAPVAIATPGVSPGATATPPAKPVTPPGASPSSPPAATPNKTATPPPATGSVGDMIKNIPVQPISDPNAFMQQLPSPPKGFNPRATVEKLLNDQWVSAYNLIQLKKRFGANLPIKAEQLDAANQLALYNKYREFFNKPALGKYPPLVAPKVVGDIVDMVSDGNAHGIEQLLGGMRKGEWDNLQTALGFPEILGKNNKTIPVVAGHLTDPKTNAVQKLQQLVGTEELKSKMTDQGASVPLFNPPSHKPEPEPSAAAEPSLTPEPSATAQPNPATPEPPAPPAPQAIPPVKPEVAPPQQRPPMPKTSGLGNKVKNRGAVPEPPAPAPEPEPVHEPTGPAAYDPNEDPKNYDDAVQHLQTHILNHLNKAGHSDVYDYIPKEDELSQSGDLKNDIFNKWFDRYRQAHGLSDQELENLLDNPGSGNMQNHSEPEPHHSEPERTPEPVREPMKSHHPVEKSKPGIYQDVIDDHVADKFASGIMNKAPIENSLRNAGIKYDDESLEQALEKATRAFAKKPPVAAHEDEIDDEDRPHRSGGNPYAPERRESGSDEDPRRKHHRHMESFQEWRAKQAS